jgi:hypothetical protein
MSFLLHSVPNSADSSGTLIDEQREEEIIACKGRFGGADRAATRFDIRNLFDS